MRRHGRTIDAMKAEERLSEAALELVAKRAKKAKKNVRAAAEGDVDGVHDLRVAVRKLRAAISVLHDSILPKDALEAEDDALSELFDALGDARDDDVMLERITTMAQRRRLGPKAVKALTEDLDDERRRARKRVRRLIDKHPPKKVLARLQKKLARAGENEPKPARGEDVPRVLVRHFVASVLHARWEAVIAYETALPAPIATLHRLRVAIKKLRYAVGFFEDALGAHAEALDRPLQLAQDVLGDLHDHDVARAYVLKRGGSEAGEVVAEEDKDAQRLHSRFESAWRAISGAEFRKRLAAAVDALWVER